MPRIKLLHNLNKIKWLVTNLLKNSIARRMAFGAFWSIFGTASSKIFVLIAGIICARILGKEVYGELGMLRSTISLFVVLGASGLGLTASKYISEYKEKDKNLISGIYILTNSFALFTAIIITLTIISFSKPLCISLLNAPHLINEFKVGGLILFITILNGAQNGILSGFENFKGIAINNFWTSIAECIFLIVGCYYWGLIGAILGYGISYLILWFLNHHTLQKEIRARNIRISCKIRWNLLQVLYKFSLPATISALLVTPVFWGVRAMLVHCNGFAESATYDVAEQWRIIILFVPNSLCQIVLPILSSIRSSNNEIKDYWKVLKINILVNAGICTMIALIISLFSNTIIKLYGTNFTNNIPIIILSISTIFSSSSAVIGMAIASLGKMWTGCLFNIIWGLIVLYMSYYFLQNSYGANGVCISIISGYIVLTLIQITYLWRQKRSF